MEFIKPLPTLNKRKRGCNSGCKPTIESDTRSLPFLKDPSAPETAHLFLDHIFGWYELSSVIVYSRCQDFLEQVLVLNILSSTNKDNILIRLSSRNRWPDRKCEQKVRGNDKSNRRFWQVEVEFLSNTSWGFFQQFESYFYVLHIILFELWPTPASDSVGDVGLHKPFRKGLSKSHSTMRNDW